jgi:hypothetical protein
MDVNQLSEAEIKNELNDYIYNVKVKYAILLNGCWGCGKTYFIKEKYIKELEQKYREDKKNNKKPVYISLYGISDVSQIKNKILLSLIKNTKIQAILPIANVVLEAGSDFVSKITFINNTDRKIKKIVDSLYPINNLVIFFDDLERCPMPINIILGYINELVEHSNIKVIIIADETKIGKSNYESNLELKYLVALSTNLKALEKDKGKEYPITGTTNENKVFSKDDVISRATYLFNENNIYNEVKEKLIGKVIHYNGDIDNIYDMFADEILTEENAKKTAIENKKFVLDYLDKEKNYNLRTLQFVFQSFNRLVKETNPYISSDKIKNLYLKDLFEYCLRKSFYMKRGKNAYNWKDNQVYGEVYLDNDIEQNVYNSYITGFRFVDDYLMDSYIDKDLIKLTLEKYIKAITEANKNPNDPLYKLNNYWTISEKDLKIIVNKLYEKISKNCYELESYSQIVRYLSSIEEMNISKETIKKIIKKMEDNIEQNIVKGSFYEDIMFDGNNSVYIIYEKNIKKIRLLIKIKEKNDNQDLIKEIYNCKNWGSEFKAFCEKNGGRFIKEKKFAYMLDFEMIEKNIRKKEISEIYQFWYGLQKVYGSSNVKEFYQNDKEELAKFNDELNKINDIDNVRIFVVKKICNFLSDVISNL